MFTLHFLFPALIITVIIATGSILVERFLIFLGITRGNTILLLIATIILALLEQIIFYFHPSFLIGLLIVLIGPIGANRYDITITFQKGRWWWKSENKSRNS